MTTQRERLLQRAREANRESAARADQFLREPMGRDEVGGVFLSLAESIAYLIEVLDLDVAERGPEPVEGVPS